MKLIICAILLTSLVLMMDDVEGCSGGRRRRRRRRTPPPPVHGGWTSWSSWTSCSKSCNTGSKSRTRSCTNPRPSNGGRSCSGASSERVNCNTQRCPVNGGYTAWSAWSECSKTCGDGEEVRQRSCTNPPPSYGGSNCDQLGPSTDKRKCNKASCTEPITEPCLQQICSSNTNNEIRGCDKQGCGHFGAPRGSGTNDGIDIKCEPGSDVFAPFVGRILQAIHDDDAKTDDDSNNGLLVTGLQGYLPYQAKVLKITPARVSGTMEPGDKIGTSVAQPYENIQQYVHIKIYKDGVIVDPTSWPVCPKK